jgi:protein gp37
MADTTKIDWVVDLARSRGMDARVWNPVRGCRPISSGCKNCWAARVADTRSANPNTTIARRHVGLTNRNADDQPVFNGTSRLLPDDLELPLRTKRPSVFFAPSEGDLCAPGIDDGMRDRILAVMALTPQHLYVTLTKRPVAMQKYITPNSTWIRVEAEIAARVGNKEARPFARTWPLANLWLGVSVENQGAADNRIPALMGTPAAVRLLSCEPLLEAVDILWTLDPLNPRRPDWVIVGGESGPKARPMYPEWARSLHDQCAATGIPFYFKQWGEWGSADDLPSEIQEDCDARGLTEGPCVRVGKRAAGRALDGRDHRAIPVLTTGA